MVNLGERSSLLGHARTAHILTGGITGSLNFPSRIGPFPQQKGNYHGSAGARHGSTSSRCFRDNRGQRKVRGDLLVPERTNHVLPPAKAGSIRIRSS